MNCQLVAQQLCHKLTRLSHNDVGSHTCSPISRLKLSWGGNQNGPENGDSTQEDLVSLNSYFTQSIVAQIEPKLVRSEIRMSKKESNDVSVCVTTWRVRWHSETIHWYRVSVWANFCHIYHSFIWCLNPVIAYYKYLYAISKFFWLKLTIVLCVSLSCLMFHSGL